MAKAKTVATVLSFEKKLVPSDGYLYGTTWPQRAEAAQALPLVEKSVRGTISNRLKAAIKSDPLKLNAEVEKPNLQKVDACALDENQDTLKLHFTLKVLGNLDQPSACNSEEFNQSYAQAVQQYQAEHGYAELARRYATNIANARYLWRNRLGAEQIEVVVKDGETEWVFNAFDYALNHFDANDAQIQALAAVIEQALNGTRPYLLLDICAYALIGVAQEVYPSEELVLDKGKGDKSKILYAKNEIAALHSQKIGNALRSIDTWYPEFDSAQLAIAIEPYGAVTNLGKAYRNPKDKADFYTLFDKFALGEKLETVEQQHYVMAVLVRGGVFGQSGKD